MEPFTDMKPPGDLLAMTTESDPVYWAPTIRKNPAGAPFETLLVTRQTFPADVIAVLTAMSVIDLMAILGNVSLAVVILKSPHLRNQLTYIFVLNLVFVDLLSSLILLPVSIVTYAYDNWILGCQVCYANGFFSSFFTFASILSMCVISAERYYSIKMPMHYAANVTLFRALAVIGAVWIQSIILAVLPLFGWNSYTYRRQRAHCSFSWNVDGYHRFYIITMAVLCFIIPGCIILLMYMGIYRVAKHTATQVHPEPEVSQNASPSPDNASHKVEQHPTIVISGSCQPSCAPFGAEQPYRRPLGHWKAIKTLLLITTMFMVLWGPLFIINIYGVIHGRIAHAHVMELAATWLGFASFAVNPFIYGWMNRTVREELMSTVKQCYNCVTRSREECDDGAFPGNEDFYEFLERTSTTRTLSIPHSRQCAEKRHTPIVEELETCNSNSTS